MLRLLHNRLNPSRITLLTCLLAIFLHSTSLAQTSPEFNLPTRPSLGQYTTEYLPTTTGNNPQLEQIYKLLVDFHFSRALHQLNTLLSQGKLTTKQASEAWSLKGYVYLNQRRAKEAIEALHKAIELDPQNSTAYFFLANEYYIDGRQDLTTQYLQQAVKIRPTFVSAHRMLAELAREKGMTTLAAQKYQEIVNLLPRSGYYNYQLYKALLRDGQYAQAVATLKNLIELEPGYSRNYYRLGNLYLTWYRAKLQEGRPEPELLDKAATAFNEYSSLEPHNYGSFLGPAELAYENKDYIQAEKLARTAEHLSPGNPAVEKLLARLQEHRRRQNRRRMMAGISSTLVILIAALIGLYLRSSRRKAYVLSLLTRFNDETEGLYDFEAFKELTRNFLQQELGIQQLSLLIYSANTSTLSEQQSEDDNGTGIHITTGREVTHWHLTHQQTLLNLKDLRDDEEFNQAFPDLVPLLERQGLHSLVCLREGVIFRGFLALGWPDHPQADRYLDILVPLSALVSQGAERLHLYQTSMHDELTGLYNRRCFERILETELRRSARYKQPCSLVIFDIDDFKQINDTYGHTQGDEVLKELAELVNTSLRDGIDTAARIGGEEFAVILPATPLGLAVQTAQRILSKCSAHKFNGLPPRHKVTLSMGVCDYPHHAEDMKMLISKADEAQYRAKRSGKNRVCAAGEINPDVATDIPRLGTARLSELNILDPKTGLYNYGYLLLRLTEEIHRSVRTGSPPCVAVIGLDKCAAESPDETELRALALLLKEQVREGIDIAARLETGEFALLLPDTATEDGFFVVERYRQAVEEQFKEKRITVSGGVSTTPTDCTGNPALSMLHSAYNAFKLAHKDGNVIFISTNGEPRSSAEEVKA